MFFDEQYAARAMPALDREQKKPDDLSFLTDSVAALALLRECRWREGRFCPRCQSRNVRDSKSFVYRELLRCSDCSYTFNPCSMTIFQGTKLPLHKQFQLLMAIDLLGTNHTSREIADSVEVSERTVKLHQSKTERVRGGDGCSWIRGGAGVYSPGSLIMDVLADDRVSLDRETFKRRLCEWLSL